MVVATTTNIIIGPHHTNAEQHIGVKIRLRVDKNAKWCSAASLSLLQQKFLVAYPYPSLAVSYAL